MDKDWKRQLRREASLHGMCEENRTALESIDSRADAIALYKKTIDWALEEGYPHLDTIRKNFADCEAYGLFVDKEFHGEVLLDQQVYVFHNCTGTIKVGLNERRRIIPMLYFANGCNMTVKGLDEDAPSVYVPLYIFGQNRISTEQSENIECKIYKFDVK